MNKMLVVGSRSDYALIQSCRLENGDQVLFYSSFKKFAMKRTSLFIFSVLSIAIFARAGHAQTGDITDGFNSFFFTAEQLIGDGPPFVGTNDILFEEEWFLVSGWLDKAPAGNISISVDTTSSPIAGYSDVAGAVFDFDLGYQVGSSPTGVVDLDIDLELTVQSTLPISVGPNPIIGSLKTNFNYDNNGFSVQTELMTDTPIPNIAQLLPGLGSGVFPTDLGAVDFDIEAFSTLLNSLPAEKLLDSVPLDLLSKAESIPNFRVIDATSEFQLDFELTPGEGETSFSITASGFVEVAIVAIPEPSTLAMFSFLGVAATLRRSRKR